MRKHKILLPGGVVLTSGPGTADAIRSVKLTEQVNDQTDLCPGAACAACAELELWAPENRLQIAQGDELTLLCLDTGTGAEETLGVFRAEKPVKASANVYKITAYDRMTLLDRDLSPWLRAQQGAFPMTLTALIGAVCAQCGVALADGALAGLPNGEYAVQPFYADGLTGRQLIQWAAQAACRFARMDPAGRLTFGWYAGRGAAGLIGPSEGQARMGLRLAGAVLRTAAGEVWRFGSMQTGYLQGSLSCEDYETAPPDKVQIRQSADDVGVVWPPDEPGTNALVIQGNLLLTAQTADALRPVARTLYEALCETSYTPLTVSVPVSGALPAPGEEIAVCDAWGRQRITRVMQRTVAGQKAVLTATGNPRRDGTAAVNEQKYTDLQGKLLEIRTGIDGLNVKAGDLADDYTNLSQTVDGLELVVVKDGEVRTAFAADDTSVTITTGVIAFASNTITIDSENFKLDRNGAVSAAGTFSTDNGLKGQGRNTAELSSGALRFTRTTSDGSPRLSLELFSTGTNASLGCLYLYGPGGGYQTAQASIYTSYTGGGMTLNRADTTNGIILDGSSGYGKFTGNLDVQGSTGLGVSHTVSCQNLNAWGSKNRIVRTSFGAVKMAAFETPEPDFADSGSARCDETGVCALVLHPRYAETVAPGAAPRWLVTPTAPGALWVEKAGPWYALVHGSPGQTFDWMCIAPQKGCAAQYAELCEQAPPAEYDAARARLDALPILMAALDQAQDALLENTEHTEILYQLLGG